MIFMYFLLYFLQIFVKCQRTPIIYDEKISMQSVYLAQMTYCTSLETCENCILDYEVESYGSKALMGYDNVTDAIFTAFRGSSNAYNWMENVQIGHITPYIDQSLSVEKGFYKAYGYIKSEIFENLGILTKKYRTNTLLLTGHSLGSALCTLFAYDLINTEYELRYFYNFGSPRVGNDAFVKDFDEYIDGFRVVHNNDIVVSVPPQIFGYAHVSQGVCYNEENSAYIYCDDDDKGNYSSSDHLNYLNITMGSSGC